MLNINMHTHTTDTLRTKVGLALAALRFAYCALSSLTILDALDRVNVDACVDWILSYPQQNSPGCQSQGFTKFPHFMVISKVILRNSQYENRSSCKTRSSTAAAGSWQFNALRRCMNYEGAFGPVPRAESHAAYVFCAVQVPVAGKCDGCIRRSGIF